MDFDIHWAEDAYNIIRATDDDIAAIAGSVGRFGFSVEDVRVIKNHIFHAQHVLDRHPPPQLARFDADPRMAEAWMRLAGGEPHPSDIDLLAHEKLEAAYMANTGDRSYSRAHEAAISAGHSWDPEAAAADGLGYQVPR